MIASGVVPGPKLATAASGTMVETRVETEAPVEPPPRTLAVKALSCWLRTASAASAAALVSAVDAVVEAVGLGAVKAPPAPAVDWVPLTLPPDVLI